MTAPAATGPHTFTTQTKDGSGGTLMTLTAGSPVIPVFGAATKVGFTTQPGNGTGGSDLSTQPVVAVQDAGGNTVTTATNSITVTEIAAAVETSVPTSRPSSP